MDRFIKFQCVIGLILALAGCGGNSESGDQVNCNALTASQCLDQSVYDQCSDTVDDIDTFCSDVLEDKAASSKTELSLVPELSGDDDTIRERYDVYYENQPFLFIPQESTLSSYTMHTIQYELLNANDLIAHDSVHGDDFTGIELDPVLVFPTGSKSKAPTDFLPMPTMITNPQSMFQGLSYSSSLIGTYLDSLFTGKVGAWNENGLEVESCEEYVYENFYDFSLFKDFLALHQDDPVRVVEYAYRNATVNEDGIPVIVLNEIGPGAIGARGLYHFNHLMWDHSPDELFEGFSDMYQVFQRKGGNDGTIEPTSVFQDHQLSYASYGTQSSFQTTYSGYITATDYFDNELTPDYPEIVVDGASAGFRTIAKDPVPKNFFIEIMGKINPENQNRETGVVLSDPDLLAVYNRDDFAIAKACYTNNFYLHFYMLKAAKRLYPNVSTLKTKLREYRMLRRHLIELLAERSRYESIMAVLSGTSSADMLKNAVTLPRSEKEFAIRRIQEFTSGHSTYSDNQASKASMIDIIDDVPQLVDIRASLDDQIEAVLKDAMAKGCLDTALDESQGNYVTAYNIDGTPSSVSDGVMMLFEPNPDYDKVLCDWTPEMFTVAADQLIPDTVTERVYDDCRRITANDFENTGVQSYRFRFPSLCQENSKFEAWDPNGWNDYTENTVRFHEFESLVKAYPAALLDCDNVIQKATLDSLEEQDMNYFDPVSGAIMMSKSTSNFYEIGGEYAGLNFGYALGWLYEGYENVDDISNNETFDRNTVCANTNFFAFGNYFAGGSFLKRDFTLCAAGSYASNKTAAGSRPVPPTLADTDLNAHINSDIQEVASDEGVATNYFLFIKNEKMTFSYDNGNFEQEPYTDIRSEPYIAGQVTYQSDDSAPQMISVEMKQSVPICGIMSITINGKVTGDIDAASIISGDIASSYSGENTCKAMNFNFTPSLDFDGFASASVTAGLSGVASVSAGVDIGLKFAHVAFPYSAQLAVSQYNGALVDRDFNYDIWVKAHNALNQETTFLSGYFGAFIKLEYPFGSDTYHQKLFSWDGIKSSGEIESLATSEAPFTAPVRALNGLSNLRF